jgi:alpha-D-xyloside xylohydrolase
VTDRAGTIMRPLVMDWRTDERVWNIGDQFLFGPALMVAPVTAGGPDVAPGLPAQDGGLVRLLDRQEGRRGPLDRRPGAARPHPAVREGRGDPAAGRGRGIRRPGAARAAGAAGLRRGGRAFTLYDDAGDSYAYERGERATIAVTWRNGARRLELGARSGTFPGLVRDRTFKVVLVDSRGSRSKTVRYDGTAAAVVF